MCLDIEIMTSNIVRTVSRSLRNNIKHDTQSSSFSSKVAIRNIPISVAYIAMVTDLKHYKPHTMCAYTMVGLYDKKR